MVDKLKIGRREFLAIAGTASLVAVVTACREPVIAQRTGPSLLDALRRNALSNVDDEWWGARHVPDSVTSKAVIATSADTGDRIVISGTVFESDGKTAAPNILIYLYHTDIYGIYGRGEEHRHGRYRAWLLTDKEGKYSFETIRPASYPNSTQSAHIHMTLTTATQKEDWIDSILFEGDSFITARERTVEKGGISGIVKLAKNGSGILSATRDIRLA
jgi:Protocatechuate 3,4-dioxygenase beta subunit